MDNKKRDLKPEEAARILEQADAGTLDDGMDEEDDVIILRDEAGEEHEFQVEFMLDKEIDDNQYLIVTEAGSDEGEAIALKLLGEELIVVDDDETLEKINAYLNQG